MRGEGEEGREEGEGGRGRKVNSRGEWTQLILFLFSFFFLLFFTPWLQIEMLSDPYPVGRPRVHDTTDEVRNKDVRIAE